MELTDAVQAILDARRRRDRAMVSLDDAELAAAHAKIEAVAPNEWLKHKANIKAKSNELAAAESALAALTGQGG